MSPTCKLVIVRKSPGLCLYCPDAGMFCWYQPAKSINESTSPFGSNERCFVILLLAVVVPWGRLTIAKVLDGYAG